MNTIRAVSLKWARLLLLQVFGTLFFGAPAMAANTVVSATVNGGASTTVAPGAPITVAVTNTTSGGTSWGSTRWTIATSAPASGTGNCDTAPTPTISTNGTNATTLVGTVPIVAPFAPGTYNLYIQTYSNASNCSSSQSAMYTLAGAVVVPYAACTPPAGAPAGLTCQCDTFNRAMLQPSTIFNSNWIVSNSDATGIQPSIVNPGYLRLTNNTGNNAKAATVPGIFPAAGNYISVEFQQYAYNGSGADGIALTLSDYSVPAAPGAYGGSLGYAQETGINGGFAGGWIGVALDEYGNYQNNNEGRVNGTNPAGGFITQSVGIRGSGSGQTGYQLLGGTSTLTPQIDSSASTNPAIGYYYQVIVDARNEPTSTAISVNRNIFDGNGYTNLISIPNVYTAAAGTGLGLTQSPVPANWQLSFTGSTGGSTNIHEIGGLRICASNMQPPSGGTAGGFSAIDESYGAPPAVAVQNYLTGHIFTKLVGTSFKLNVAALSNGQMLTTYAAGSAKNVTVNLVDNSDSIADASKDCTITCSATCTSKAAVTGGTQTVTFASGATDKGQKQSANFTINSAYQKLVAIMTDGITTACSVDAFSVRPTALSVATSATNTTSTGAPIFKAGSDTFTLNVTATNYSLAAATVPQTLSTVTGYTGSPGTGTISIAPMGAGSWTVGGLSTGTSLTAAVASVSTNNPTYSEVGLFKLTGLWPNTTGYASGDDTTARGIADTTWTLVDSVPTKGDCVVGSFSNKINGAGKYGCNFGSVTDTTFGRFIPDHFDTTAVQTGVMPAIVPMGCPGGLICPSNTSGAVGMVYSGQPFSLQVTAKNLAGNTTANYQNSFAKVVSLSPVASSGGAAITAPAPGGTLLPASASVPVASFTLGTNATALALPIFNFATPLTTPTDVDLRAIDTDAASSLRTPAPSSTEGGVKVASGKLSLPNAYGSEKLPLILPVTVQYYNGTYWLLSATDNFTSLNTNLSTASGNLVATNYVAPLSSLVVTSPGLAAVVAGARTITLAAPGVTGSVNLSINTPTYLPTNPNNAGTATPGRITFGIFKSPLIYRRENY